MRSLLAWLLFGNPSKALGAGLMRCLLVMAASIFCVFCVMETALAATVSPDYKKDKNYKKLSAKVEQLQQEVDGLKATLSKKKTAQAEMAEMAADAGNNTDATTWFPMDFGVPGKSFVSTGPYIGVPIAWSGGHLIINAPSVNQDVALLRLRYDIRRHLRSLGIKEPPGTAHVLLSGIVEGAGYWQMSGEGANSSNIDLAAAGLDAYILGPGEWLNGLIAFSYDNSSGASTGTYANFSPVQNSRVYVSQAFLTVGRLAVTPFYGTLGQLYVPFGTYSSNMVAAPLTKQLSGTKARALVIGYQPVERNGLYAAGYVFRGDSHGGAASRINNGGLNGGYRFTQGPATADLGAGVIANLADSVGMQNVGNSTGIFNGFGGTNGTGNEEITHRVPALNIRGMVNIGPAVTLLGEYVAATTAFSANDLTLNGRGAKPRALNAEAAYTFTAFARPTTVAAGYAMTKDALALNLPAERYSLVLNTSIWRDTLQSLEFRHERSYAASATASGSGIAASPQNGRADNIITAQFDLYF